MTQPSVSNPTRVDEIAAGIYRFATAIDLPDGPGAFSFNQFLIDDDEPLLFHTGPRKLFPLVRQSVEKIMPLARLRYIGCSHFEADECGALNDFLALAPRAQPVCGQIAAMISMNDYADRPALALSDGAALKFGRHEVRWSDAPHMPHAWECGFLMETTTSTLLCGDLFTQGGKDHPSLTTGDILGPSEKLRKSLDFYAHAGNTRAVIERIAKEQPATLACMHGSAWKGDGAALLRALADRVA